jgi:hypothetical protein
MLMLFFSLTISCLILTSFAFAFSQIANVKFTNSFSPVVAILLSFLTFAAMCGVLYGATYCTYIVGIVLGIYLSFKKADILKSTLIEHSAEIVFLILIVVLYSFFMRNAILTVWDDFSHWGVFSKELFLYNGIEHQGMMTSIIDTHAHYPRAASIYHYFMLFGSGYSESGLLIAHFIFHLIFLAPLLGNRNVLITVFFVSSIFASVALYTTAFRSIYNDSTTALILSSILSVYLLETDRRKAILLALIISAFFPLFREVGLVLSLLAAIFIMY